MERAEYNKRLEVPTGKVVDVIIDTDAYNEVDDQFAIAYAFRSPERINVISLCAAPFSNKRSKSAADGMNQSYDEILKLLRLMEKEDFVPNVYRGSESYLPDEKTPVNSAAAYKMVEEARKHTAEDPLYIVALGAITNVASAILLDREAIINNTVIVWLGGHAFHWHDNAEFNARQDVAAARVVMDCGAPLILLPCKGVVSALTTTGAELRYWLSDSGPLGEYLAENAITEAESYAKGTAWSRCIWDVSAVAWLLNDNDRFMNSYLTASPIPEYDNRYSFDPRRHQITYVYGINRDAVFTDMFSKLRGERPVSCADPHKC